MIVVQSSQMKIEVTDNNKGQKDKIEYDRKEISALFPIAGKMLKDLCRNNPRLLIFPHCLKQSEDLEDDKPIFTIDNTSDSEKVCITAGNVMGFIGVKDIRLKIKSRFDAQDKDYFLHYMLHKVFSINLFDMNHGSKQEEVFDFLVCMFPCLLNRAMRQGVYKEYRRFQHNDANIKGTIDVSRHIVHNTPFVGNIAYTTREYAHDNSMTQLIRHTIEYIKARKLGMAVLSKDKVTKDNVKSIIDYTPSYSKSQRCTVISNNLRSKRHPFYTEYQPLQILCLQILRHERIKYGNDNDELRGILFDGAWLWEEYVYTLLRGKGFKHPENKKGKGGILLFEEGRRKCFPDFYNDDIVLDAKYKRLDSCSNVSSVGREDLYQLITYMTRLQVTKGGFIAPLVEKQSSVPCSKLKDVALSLSIFGIVVNNSVKSYEEFCKAMQQNELDFLK